MFNRPSRARRWLVGALVSMALFAAWLWSAGSVVVDDDTDQVTAAVITDGGHPPRKQRLYRLWKGHFYGIPRYEGVVELHCRNGAQKQWGYVSSHSRTKVRVTGEPSCRNARVDYRQSGMDAY